MKIVSKKVFDKKRLTFWVYGKSAPIRYFQKVYRTEAALVSANNQLID